MGEEVEISVVILCILEKVYTWWLALLQSNVLSFCRCHILPY